MTNHEGNVIIHFFGEGSVMFMSLICEVFVLWF